MKSTTTLQRILGGASLIAVALLSTAPAEAAWLLATKKTAQKKAAQQQAAKAQQQTEQAAILESIQQAANLPEEESKNNESLAAAADAAVPPRVARLRQQRAAHQQAVAKKREARQQALAEKRAARKRAAGDANVEQIVSAAIEAPELSKSEKLANLRADLIKTGQMIEHSHKQLSTIPQKTIAARQWEARAEDALTTLKSKPLDQQNPKAIEKAKRQLVQAHKDAENYEESYHKANALLQGQMEKLKQDTQAEADLTTEIAAGNKADRKAARINAADAVLKTAKEANAAAAAKRHAAEQDSDIEEALPLLIDSAPPASRDNSYLLDQPTRVSLSVAYSAEGNADSLQQPPSGRGLSQRSDEEQPRVDSLD